MGSFEANQNIYNFVKKYILSYQVKIILYDQISLITLTHESNL